MANYLGRSLRKVSWSGLPENIDSKSSNLGMKGKRVKSRSTTSSMSSIQKAKFSGVSNNNQDLGSVGLKKGLPKPISMKDNR